MDIYILRSGEEIGPFSKDAAQILISQGSVSVDDLAWRQGAPGWRPLREVLEENPLDISQLAKPPPTAPSGHPSEPATATQIAFLSYVGMALPAGLSKDGADGLITKVKADPKNAERLASWEIDRLRLHPDLFSAEVREKKEDRVQLFFDLCQTAGADHFTGVTKAHCQVLVAFLDVKFPRWDAHEAAATERYFFPAIAEKFPQLVNKASRGRLHYGDGSSATVKARRKSATAKLVKGKTASPWGAIGRGVALGLLILAVLYAVHLSRQSGKGHPSQPEKGGASARPFTPETSRGGRALTAALSSAFPAGG